MVSSTLHLTPVTAITTVMVITLLILLILLMLPTLPTLPTLLMLLMLPREFRPPVSIPSQAGDSTRGVPTTREVEDT